MATPQISEPAIISELAVVKSSLQPGDHIYRFRIAGLYSHHGIYAGDGQVIHFNIPPRTQLIAQLAKEGSIPMDMELDLEPDRPCGRCAGFGGGGGSGTKLTIVKCCIDCFGDKIYLYKYEVSWPEFFLRKRGTCCPYKSKPLKEAVKTANDLIQTGFGDYNLILNNCEHFATFCRTGSKFSGQVFIRYPLLEQKPTHEIENIAAGNCTNEMMLEAAN